MKTGKTELTKTVAVNCVLCGWVGRKHRTEMNEHGNKCSKCKKNGVYHASPAGNKFEGRKISRREAYEGLGDPRTWPAHAAKLKREFSKEPKKG